MMMKRCPLIFDNVLSAKAICRSDEWYNMALDLRNAVIKNGLYGTGPVIYQMSKEDTDGRSEYTFYLPVNAPIQMVSNDKYAFYEKWKFDDGLVLRHADLSEDIGESYSIIRAYAEEYNLILEEPFYNIYLDVYGGGIVDIYAPILKER